MSVLEKKIERKKSEKKVFKAAKTKIAKKLPEVLPQAIEKPYLINRGYSPVYIYPEKGEGFTAYVIPFPYANKSAFSENQLTSKKLQEDYIKRNLIKEATEEELAEFLKSVKGSYPEDFQAKQTPDTKPNVWGRSASTEKLESSGVGGLSSFFDSVVNPDDVESFKDRFLGKLGDKINPKAPVVKPNVRIIDMLLTAAEDKLNEMVGIAVSEVKTELNTKIDEIVEKTLNSDNLIDKIKSSVKEPRIIKPEPINDKKGPIISGDDKIVIRDGQKTYTRHLNDPAGCWSFEENKSKEEEKV